MLMLGVGVLAIILLIGAGIYLFRRMPPNDSSQPLPFSVHTDRLESLSVRAGEQGRLPMEMPPDDFARVMERTVVRAGDEVFHG